MVLVILSGCNRSPESKTEASEAVISGPLAEEALRQSALDGDLEQVKQLLDAGTHINALDQEGHTALMYAAFNGYTEIVLLLLDKDAVVDRRDLLGRTALLYASTGPFPGTVKVLLDRGAEPNIVDSDEHFSPLMHAAAEGHLQVVKLLMEFGADPALTDVDGDDAEFFARQAGHIQVADYFSTLD